MELMAECKKRRIEMIKKLLFEGYTFAEIDKLREYKREGWESSHNFVKENPEHFENIGFVRRK